MKFVAFGDTPYDEEAPAPYFEGQEYACLQKTLLPGVKLNLASQVDFMAHVGDIKKGSSTYSQYCTDQLFSSRSSLFSIAESSPNLIDFFIIPGDNEWNECTGYNTNPTVNDVIKTRWRSYFTTGTLAGFNRSPLPSGATSPSVYRPVNQPQNFFFYYNTKNIAFFGITEPAGDTYYDPVNAAFVSDQLSGKSPSAIVIFGHSNLSSNVLSVLDSYKTIPTLYVTGNDHIYCMKFLDKNRFPKLVQLTVEAYLSSPFVVSVVQDTTSGEHFFHILRTSYGCS